MKGNQIALPPPPSPPPSKGCILKVQRSHGMGVGLRSGYANFPIFLQFFFDQKPCSQALLKKLLDTEGAMVL